jgi:uncharacterized membrane protein YjjP (DUF1212 family)
MSTAGNPFKLSGQYQPPYLCCSTCLALHGEVLQVSLTAVTSLVLLLTEQAINKAAANTVNTVIILVFIILCFNVIIKVWQDLKKLI